MTTIQNQILSFTVSAHGAELTSLRGIKDGHEYLWQADQKIWPRSAPVLFPIVGKLVKNQYTVDGLHFSLTQHGFARDREFTKVEQTNSALVYELRSDDESLKNYPFRFTLQVGYRLVENTLIESYSVFNNDSRSMFFSVGAHPGFRCNYSHQEGLENHYLEFDREENAERHFLQDGVFSGARGLILNGRTLRLSSGLFDRDAVIFKKLNSKSVTLRAEGSTRSVRVDFEGFPYLGIWSKPGAPFVCIEPWCGLADSKVSDGNLYAKEGIIELAAGAEFKREFKVAIT